AITKAAEEAGLILGHARQRLELKADLSFPAAALVREMVRSSSPKAAVAALVRFYFERFGVPVVAWLSEGPGREAELVAARGLGSRRSAQLRQNLGSIPRWERLSLEQRKRLEWDFVDVVETADVSILHVGNALVLVGAAGPALDRSMKVLGPLLGDVFSHLATVRWAERRNEGLDMGIALTAHEVRGPLLGAKAAIEHVLMRGNGDGRERD